MSRPLYPSPKSVAVQPGSGETEKMCDVLPHLSLSGTPQKTKGAPCGESVKHAASFSLGEFITLLPETIKNSHSVHKFVDNFNGKGTDDNDDISSLFSRIDLRKEDWEPYAFFDPSKLYTRNLVATDDETYTLILMCWNAGKSSPVHDHPCDGCWMQVCEGCVRETRYVKGDDESDILQCVSEELYTGECSTDNMVICICIIPYLICDTLLSHMHNFLLLHVCIFF